MSHLLRLVAVLGLLTVTTALADNTNPDRPRGTKIADSDLDRLQGKWVVVGVEFDGRDCTEVFSTMISVTATIKEDWLYASATPGREVRLILQNDCGQAQMLLVCDNPIDSLDKEFPRTITLYKLEGDTLKLCCCRTTSGQPLKEPKVFTSQNEQFILTFRRE